MEETKAKEGMEDDAERMHAEGFLGVCWRGVGWSCGAG